MLWLWKVLYSVSSRDGVDRSGGTALHVLTRSCRGGVMRGVRDGPCLGARPVPARRECVMLGLGAIALLVLRGFNIYATCARGAHRLRKGRRGHADAGDPVVLKPPIPAHRLLS